jgi:hypothetical protein
MRLLRRLLAVALALLVLLEAGGVARALAADGEIDCCCGEHSAVRTCHCHDCPVARRGQQVREGDHLDSQRCGGGAQDVGVLAVMAHALPAPPVLAGPRLVSRTPVVRSLVRAGRLVEAGRPPP